jgi:hypothetical protein
MSNTQLNKPNPLALLDYTNEFVSTYFCMSKEDVSRLRESHPDVNITNDGGITIVRMNGATLQPNNTDFIIVTSNTQPPDDDPGAGAGRIRIVPVSVESEVDNTVSLIRNAFRQILNLTQEILGGYVSAVLSIVKKLKTGGRIRRSSTRKSSAKKRASVRRRRRRSAAKKRSTRRR